MTPELFKPIPGFEAFYVISSYGRVFSLNYRRTGQMKELAQSSLFDKRRASESRYRRAKLWHITPKSPTAIHRLVALAFIPNPLGLREVNHIDGDKANNHVENLEWVDCSRNQKHAAEMGLHVYPKGSAHHEAILTEDQVRSIKARLLAPYRGLQKDLAAQYGVSKYCIHDIRRGKSWRHIS